MVQTTSPKNTSESCSLGEMIEAPLHLILLSDLASKGPKVAFYVLSLPSHYMFNTMFNHQHKMRDSPSVLFKAGVANGFNLCDMAPKNHNKVLNEIHTPTHPHTDIEYPPPSPTRRDSLSRPCVSTAPSCTVGPPVMHAMICTLGNCRVASWARAAASDRRPGRAMLRLQSWLQCQRCSLRGQWRNPSKTNQMENT